MKPSRAVLVLGMHRSGTSAISRGMQALGVYIGNNFLEERPDNPTGYWEDKGIFDLNERVIAVFGHQWDDIWLIDDTTWNGPELETLRDEAAAYLRANFTTHSLWGFKDPRSIRLLPFWQAVLQSLNVEDIYVVVIRNPRSVAISLYERQGMDAKTSRILWLVYMVPYFKLIRSKRFVVTDYDLFMDSARNQLERIAQRLDIRLDAPNLPATDDFVTRFLDLDLRHTFFKEDDFDLDPNLNPLSREAYLWLRMLANDELPCDSERFWQAWERADRSLKILLERF